ncbi:endonuclease III [Candidatus Micrarchaeota archaeon]|nr:endonuclease III [Candidatus Micrarchaeota archaeon]MBU1166243.1 endonuclease III [Candidatus Micrarchaeota archaeon]MBU1886800.1 endonuclease III [Candidatus Micrarchaeota archaeon]
MSNAVLENIGVVLQKMEGEALKRNAPVFRAELATKSTPFKILVFTMLSARTKDETTLKVVERLFQYVRTPEQLAKLKTSKLETLLYGVGFYRVKAKNLIETSKTIAKLGKVPDTLESLLQLPGVGRKTANIVLARAFGKNTLGVDVHVHRISNRLGLVKTKKPEETEMALIKIVPKQYLGKLNKSFVAFGQTICLPKTPRCTECPANSICPKKGVKTIS